MSIYQQGTRQSCVQRSTFVSKTMLTVSRFIVALGVCAALASPLAATAGPFGPSGSFGVAPSGAATYSLGIAVPPGPAGVQPSVSLNYSSQGGDGIFGLGWSLSGLSAITRCPRTMATHGIKSGVNLTSTDQFCLDGQPLIAVAGAYGAPNTEYRTEIQSFSKIVSYGQSGTGPEYFRVWTKSGQTLDYGSDGVTPQAGTSNTLGSQLKIPAGAPNQNTVIAWNLNKSEDRSGNTITYLYWNTWYFDGTLSTWMSQQVLSAIYYGANSKMSPPQPSTATVSFAYEVRNPGSWHDVGVAYVGGVTVTRPYRVSRIVTYATNAAGNNEGVREYSLKYDRADSQRSRLVGFQECYNPNWAANQACTFNDVGTTQSSQDGTSSIPVRFSWYNGSAAALSQAWDQPMAPLPYGQPYGTTYENYIPALGDFNGDGKSDILWYHKATNDRVLWLSNAGNTYTTLLGPGHGLPSATLSRVAVVDVNADGKSDVIMYRDAVGADPNCDPFNGCVQTSAFFTVTTFISNGDGTFQNGVVRTQYFATPGGLGAVAGLTPIFGDFDGDARVDIVWNIAAVAQRIFWRSLGNGDYGVYLNFANMDSQMPPNFVPQAGDFNGDGLTDIFWASVDGSGTYTSVRKIWTTQPGGVASGNIVVAVTHGVGGIDETHHGWRFTPVDLNGDGKTDLLGHETDLSVNNNGGLYSLLFSRGDGTFNYVANPFGVNPQTGDYRWYVYSALSFGDFNGDGAIDILFDQRDNNTGSSYGNRWMRLGSPSGMGWTEIANVANSNGQDVGTQIQVGDFDGDGKSDLFLDLKHGGNPDSAGTNAAKILRNKYGVTATTGMASGIAGLTIQDSVHGVSDAIGMIQDGANRQHTVEYLPMTRNPVSGWLYQTWSQATYPNLTMTTPQQLVHISGSSNGRGAELNYASYAYANMTANVLGRGATGFEVFYAIDWTSGIHTHRIFDKGFPWIGKEVGRASYFYDGAGTLYQIATAQTSYSATTTATVSGPVIWFPFPTQAVTQTNDINPEHGAAANGPRAFVSRNATSYTYDALGNLTQSIMQGKKADDTPDGYRVQTNNEYYAADNATWTMGKLKCSAVTTTWPEAVPAARQSMTRTTAFEYSATGSKLLTKTIVEPGTQCLGAPGVSTDATLRVITQINSRDGYGNATMATVSPDPSIGSLHPAYFAPQITKNDYVSGNSYGRMAMTESIQVGNLASNVHATVRTFDFGKGLLLSEEVLKGATNSASGDGLKTTYTYNRLGRRMTATGPDGVQTTYSYELCTNAIACTSWIDRMYMVTTTTPGVPTSVMQFDHLDRKLQLLVVDANTANALNVREYVAYDPSGRIFRSYIPFMQSAGPGNYSESQFDRLDRVVQTTDPDFHVTTFGYNGRSRWSRDARAVQTRTVSNSLGKAQQVIQAEGVAGKQTTLEYTYFPDGNAQTVTTYEGAVAKAKAWFDYDVRGRKTGSADPDAGTYSYAYDALGQIKSQTDPRGLTTTFQYDRVGRLTARLDPTVNAYFAYDRVEAGCSVSSLVRGKRTAAWTSAGTSTNSCFDALGRVTGTSKSYTPSGQSTAQSTLLQTVSYDSVGRISGTWYNVPGGGLSLTNNYKANGYLDSIVDGATPSRVHWQASWRDEAGRVSYEWLGRNLANTSGEPGVIVQRMFGFRGTLDQVYAYVSSTGTGIHWHGYGYDPVLNVASRGWWDGTTTRSETFLYDVHNRLTTVSGASSKSYDYDGRGNLKSKDGLTYNYPSPVAPDTNYRNQLASVTGTLNGVANPSYQYDLAGNLEKECPAGNCATPTRELTWTAAGYPSRIKKGSGAQLDFLYDADHARVRQIATVAGVATTSYYGPGGLERIDSGGTSSYRLYLGFGTIVIAASGTREYRYQVPDQLGSTSTTISPTGTVTERVGFDTWGKRRNVDGTDNAAASSTERRGFTMHEHLASVSMIHMNGRVYDPGLARFTSADPIVSAPGNLQSHNRYSYVLNNPLRYSDPTGFSSWTELRDEFIVPVASVVAAYYAGQWVGGYFGAGAANGATVAAGQAGASYAAVPGWFANGIYSAELGGSLSSLTPLGGAVSGAAGGAAGAYVGSHGNWSATGRGAITGGLFGAVGAWGAEGNWDSYQYVAAHAAVGCVSGALGSDGCGPGALSAAAGKIATVSFQQGSASQFGATVVAGSLGAWAGGGNLGHGAYLAAMGYLFNQALTDSDGGRRRLGVPIGDPRLLAEGLRAGADVVSDMFGYIFKSDSITLASNLSLSGDVRENGQHAHHIVAANAKLAQPARDALSSVGVSINSAFNGVFVDAAYHSSLHTNVYYTTVNTMLSGVVSANDATARLSAIRVMIETRTMPR